ncbi:MAG: hypothetical protein RJA70_56 [Pseudomonadota bacterium]|jgi:CHAT domain-containing protein
MRLKVDSYWLVLSAVLAFGVASAPEVAFAQNAAEELLTQAEALSTQARELAAAGQPAEAIPLMLRAQQMQETELMPLLPEALRERFRVELTPGNIFLVELYSLIDDHVHAAELLAAEIRFHEGVAEGDRYKEDIPQWRELLSSAQVELLKQRAMQGLSLDQEGRSSEALVMLEQVLPELEQAAGVDSKLLAVANLVLGRALASARSYAAAERSFLKALGHTEATFGLNAEELLPCLSELGSLGFARGTPESGAVHLVRAHRIAQRHGSATLPSTIVDLGILLDHRDDHAEAIVVFRRAISLFEQRSGGAPTAEKLIAMMHLASAQDSAGQAGDAEATYRTIGRQLEVLIAQDPMAAGFRGAFLQRFGVHYLRRGQYAQATKLLSQAAAETARLLPEDSPTRLQQGCDLGEVYWASGDLERSLDPIGRCFDSREVDVARVLASGTEEQKRAFLGRYLVAYQKTMNAQRLGGNSNPKLNRLALNQVLRTKGRVLDAMAGSGVASRASDDPETRNLMTRLTAVRTAISQAASSGMGDPKQLQALTAEAESIEGVLSQSSASFRAATRSVDIASVQAALPSGSALLEFVAYRPMDASYQKSEPQLRYLAYVLHAAGEPVAIDLGSAEAIDAAATALHRVLSNPDHDVTAAAKALFDLVMKPVEGALDGKTQIFLSPDGALNTVPFAALIGSDGFLIQKYNFTYLTSGRDLLRLGAEKPSEGSVVAFANPEFGDGDGHTTGSSRLARVKFEPLPGTQAEADALRELFPSSVIHTGSAASEAELKKVERPLVLHIATHGFFLPERSVTSVTGDGGAASNDETAQQRLSVMENPLLRSGLAFAGATGLRGQEGEDGVLTALEASSLDLTGTQLVVLSACQTAEGELSHGEGVYGLRRALTVTGAEALVMSLWSVDDAATSYLMRGYYRRLQAGEGRSEALRNAQLALAENAPTRHPYYWAPFIPSGNPAPIVLPASSTTESADDDDDDSGSDFDWDLGLNWDDSDYELKIAPMGFDLGVAALEVKPRDLRPDSKGWQAFTALDVSVISAVWSEEFGNESWGVSAYDRAGISLAALTLSGDDLAALHADYTFVLGYRTPYLGVFGGARYGSGSTGVTDGPSNSGPYFPMAVRVEIPWFGDTRLSALGMTGALGDYRKVTGLEVRMPLGDPTVWLQGGFLRTEGRSSQHTEAVMIPFSIGFCEE